MPRSKGSVVPNSIYGRYYPTMPNLPRSPEIGRNTVTYDESRAISPRVTELSGQNLVLPDSGLQPRLIPATARRLMNASNTEFSSSTKKSVDVAGIAKARAMNAASSPRVTERSGQTALSDLLLPTTNRTHAKRGNAANTSFLT